MDGIFRLEKTNESCTHMGLYPELTLNVLVGGARVAMGSLYACLGDVSGVEFVLECFIPVFASIHGASMGGVDTYMASSVP